jgi:hypothetical protein
VIEALIGELATSLEKSGTPAEAVDEVRDLAERPPSEVGVAVVGPQNVGKTTLITVLTNSERAREDIAPTVATSVATAYKFERQGSEFVLWDTPGLGTEFPEHDAETRDLITKADAVMVTLSPDLVSETDQRQLVDLLQAGRKRGAVLPVVTEADRDPPENRPAITLAVRTIIPVVDRDPIFVAARDVEDARLEGRAEPAEANIRVLEEALINLASGEARNRVRLTAAIRLVDLIDRSTSSLTSAEPEAQRSHAFQRRIARLLVRTERRMEASVDTAGRSARLAGLRATARITTELDQQVGREALEVAEAEAWQDFLSQLEEIESTLTAALADELEKTTRELSRIGQGELAEYLRELSAAPGPGQLEQPDGPDVRDVEAARRVLRFADSATDLLGGATLKRIPLKPVADAAVGIGEVVVDSTERRLVDEAKVQLRADYLERASDASARWEDWFDEVREETTAPARSRCDLLERELFQSLSALREDLERLSDGRRRLDAYISEAMRAGYEPDHQAKS